MPKKSSKYEKWGTLYSPLSSKSMTNPSLATSNILADWSRTKPVKLSSGRFAQPIQIVINGIPLSLDGDFKKQEQLLDFFKSQLLKDLKDQSIVDTAAQYLLRSLHQGGLLHPVATAVADVISHTNPPGRYSTPQVMGERGKQDFVHFREVSFVTTPTGLLIQETVTQKALVDRGDPMDENPKDPEFLLPDKGKDHVYRIEPKQH